MTEIEIMRSRRRENTSAEAFSYVSQYRDMPMTKREIRIKAVTLEAEMLYLEGYISEEELFAKIVSAYQESDEGLICHNCGKSLSFLLWNDIAVHEDMVRYIVLPLSVPVLATLTLFYAVGRWNSFQDSLYFITNPKLQCIQHKLNNLIAFVDFNKRQLDGYTADICDLEPLDAKFRDFGWYTLRIDGNDPDKIVEAVNDAKANQGDKPAMIILDTVKGAGVKEVEDTRLNHHLNVGAEMADKAIADLKAEME